MQEEFVIIGVHVDDMPITANDIKATCHVKRELRSKFKITDLGKLTRIVGLEVTCDCNNGITTI